MGAVKYRVNGGWASLKVPTNMDDTVLLALEGLEQRAEAIEAELANIDAYISEYSTAGGE